MEYVEYPDIIQNEPEAFQKGNLDFYISYVRVIALADELFCQ
jgi:hypothetical protein